MSISEPTETEPIWEVPESVRQQLLALLSTDAARPVTMTYEEFLASADEDTLAEWVDGQVVVMSPASDRHQLLVSFFDRVLGTYVEIHGLGAVRIAPFRMKLADVGRKPDVLFVATAHLDRLGPTRLQGRADLVVEISSPESRPRDRGDKGAEYREAGIPEYWLIDPDYKQAEASTLDDRNLWVQHQKVWKVVPVDPAIPSDQPVAVGLSMPAHEEV